MQRAATRLHLKIRGALQRSGGLSVNVPVVVLERTQHDSYTNSKIWLFFLLHIRRTNGIQVLVVSGKVGGHDSCRSRQLKSTRQSADAEEEALYGLERTLGRNGL